MNVVTPAPAASASQLDSLNAKGHILFITGEYPPLRGGVGAYTQALGQALVARGWQVSVVTSATVQPDAANSSYSETSEIAVYPSIQHWGWRIWQQITHLAHQIGAEWLHVQYQTAAFGMHPAINLAPAWWQRRTRSLPHSLRLAWTYHDLLVPYLFPKAGEPLRRWITDRPAATCDLTVVTNAGDQAHLAPRARRLAYIPIGSNIAARHFAPEERQALRAQRGYAPDDLVIGYFGFLNRSKGGLALVDVLARLVQDVPTVRLLMIGERVGASDASNYAYLQEVEAAIAARGLTRHVTWTGHLPDDAVSAALAICDLLLMPYLDGASLRRGTLMAGLAHGCAIITTTPAAPIPELVGGRDLLYVSPGEPNTMAAAMAETVLELVQDPARAALLRHHARLAGAAFTWEGIAAAHEQHYCPA